MLPMHGVLFSCALLQSFLLSDTIQKVAVQFKCTSIEGGLIDHGMVLKVIHH